MQGLGRGEQSPADESYLELDGEFLLVFEESVGSEKCQVQL